MKTTQDWWWSYWGNKELEHSIQGGINHRTAKYLLWKYENHLEGQGKNGYSPTRFDKIKKQETDYNSYDEDFVNQYINCLGNYLFLSKSHNCSVDNKLFADKRNSYNNLEQQRETKK